MVPLYGPQCSWIRPGHDVGGVGADTQPPIPVHGHLLWCPALKSSALAPGSQAPSLIFGEGVYYMQKNKIIYSDTNSRTLEPIAKKMQSNGVQILFSHVPRSLYHFFSLSLSLFYSKVYYEYELPNTGLPLYLGLICPQMVCHSPSFLKSCKVKFTEIIWITVLYITICKSDRTFQLDSNGVSTGDTKLRNYFLSYCKAHCFGHLGEE